MDSEITVEGDDGGTMTFTVEGDDGGTLTLTLLGGDRASLSRNGTVILEGSETADDDSNFWYLLGLDGGVTEDEAERVFMACHNPPL